MSPRRYIVRSLLHHRFAYLGVFAGAALGATVLLGALFAGDSVAASLRRIASNRIGRATHALTGGDRFFREALAADLARTTGVRTAPLVYARGVATSASAASVGRVQLIGVTDAFWTFAPNAPAVSPIAVAAAADRAVPVAINDTLARRLRVKAQDTLIVRLQKPGILAGSAPVAGAESSLQSVRGRIAAILDDASFGRFSLDTTQVPAPSVFLPIAALQEALGQADGANLLLIEAADPKIDLAGPLASQVQLADYGLTLKWLEKAGMFELTSKRIFLDPAVANAVGTAVSSAQPVVSYLVNELRAGDHATPYSIACATTAVAAPFLPADLGPQEIVLNTWLADDLQAQPGSEVRLTFFQTGPAGTLVEQQATFRVRQVVPLAGLAADGAWMPELPGITDVDNQSDWNPGLPLKLDRIRDKDERYWDNHRGAPKAFLSLAGGRAIWSTRWGNTTALRMPIARDREAEVARTILGALRPAMSQLQIRALRANAQQAAESSVDFAGLFLGMSFFLILAALGLVAMLFQFTLLQRNREDALLGAVGLSPRKLLRWRLLEATAVLAAGALLGALFATVYTRGILRFLETIWAAETASATFVFAAQPTSIAAGILVFLLLSLATIWLTIRKQTRRALSIRLAARSEEIAPLPRIRRTSLIVAFVAIAVAIGAATASGRGLPLQAAFYLAGFAVLIAGIAGCRWWSATDPTPNRATALNAAYLAKMNLKARRGRTLTVLGLIATAVFMVLSVASFRKNVGEDWLERRTGTGGSTLWVETTAPQNAVRDNRANGFEIFEGSAKEISAIVPLRLGAGDNANCYNLNSTGQPQLLAVDSAQLAARNAFRISPATVNWKSLRATAPTGVIPALVDETTLQWALKRKVGDQLSYTDEGGRPLRVQIVGTLPDSIFQGYVVIDEQPFLDSFPSNAGYSAFLLDVRDPERVDAVRRQLTTATRDVGGRVELTRDVLAAFHQIENTYIAIFNVLGSLGVALGSLGLAITVARNLRERRGEFAVLSAIGIPQRMLARLVFAEFARLVVWGVAIGAIAAAVAVGPNIAALPTAPALELVSALVLGIVGLNLASGWLIFRWSTRDLRPTVALEAA